AGSSGLKPASALTETHIVSDATVKYSEELVSGWETTAFDDLAWLNVVAPSGGLCGPGVNPITNSTSLPVWGQNPREHQTIYARKTFTVQNPVSAFIRIWVDD